MYSIFVDELLCQSEVYQIKLLRIRVANHNILQFYIIVDIFKAVKYLQSFKLLKWLVSPLICYLIVFHLPAIYRF